jgi:polysaccharide biosynthesis protein PslG
MTETKQNIEPQPSTKFRKVVTGGSLMHRRRFLKAVGLAVVSSPALRAFGAEQPDWSAPPWAASSGLKPLGTLKTRSAREIEASRIGIGMECLDRRMYLPEKTYGHLAALGAKWARLQTGWSRCETKEGVFDFAWLDEVVNNVIAAGVKPWFNVGYGNKLYSPDAPHESAVGQVPLYDGERGVNAWKRFLSELAEHFKDRIEHWEIWNEPNISSFWHPKHKSSPTEYTRLVSISAEAIRSKHPKAQIAACVSGIAPQFIEDCLKAGMGQHISIFAIHPYNRQDGVVPEKNYAAMVGQLREITRRFAPHVRLWQGECGVPSQAESQMSHGNMDELKQAKWLVRRLMLDVFMDMDLAQYFHLCDLMESNYRQADGKAQLPPMFGILNGKTYTPKLAYAAMQSVATLFDADTHPEPGYYCALLPAASGTTLLEPYTMLFRRRGVPMLAYYQAANVLNDTPCVTVDVVLCCDSDPKRTAEILREPVLVDPIRQAVYALPAPARNAVEGQFRPSLRFENLPCLDYPLLITDASALS